MNEEFMEKQRLNLESIEKLVLANTFHADIAQFYNQCRGDSSNCFIHTHFLYRDYHDAIFALLNFLDKHGDIDLYVSFINRITFEPTTEEAAPKQFKVKLRDFALSVTKIMMKSLKYSDYELKSAYLANTKMLWGGLAALSYNIGLGLGQEYIKCFNNDVCQASLAIIENIPAVSKLREFVNIKNIIIVYHHYMQPTMDYTRYRLEENKNTSWHLDIVRQLIHATMEAKRQDMFKDVGKNYDGLWLSNQSRKEAMTEAHNAVKHAATAREQSGINPEDEFKRKQEAYLGELKGLRKSRDQYSTITNIQGKIIIALEKSDKNTVKQLKEELQNLTKNAPVAVPTPSS